MTASVLPYRCPRAWPAGMVLAPAGPAAAAAAVGAPGGRVPGMGAVPGGMAVVPNQAIAIQVELRRLADHDEVKRREAAEKAEVSSVSSFPPVDCHLLSVSRAASRIRCDRATPLHRFIAQCFG